MLGIKPVRLACVYITGHTLPNPQRHAQLHHVGGGYVGGGAAGEVEISKVSAQLIKTTYVVKQLDLLELLVRLHENVLHSDLSTDRPPSLSTSNEVTRPSSFQYAHRGSDLLPREGRQV